MSEEDSYRTVGDANEECSSGVSTGTPATRPTGIYKESLRFRRPQLLGTANIDGRVKHRKPYKSYWRKRKDTRRQNKRDFENGKNTPATEMMREFSIKVNRPKFQKYEGRGTVECEWVKKGDMGRYVPKNGPYDYGYNNVE